MSDEQWTITTLKEYILAVMASNDNATSERFTASEKNVDTQFISQQVAMAAALAAAKEAVVKAEIATEKRFEAVNEFRAVLTSQQATFVTKEAFDTAIKNMTEKVEANNGKITEINKRLSIELGQRSGLHQGWVYMLGAISIISLIATMVFHFLPT